MTPRLTRAELQRIREFPMETDVGRLAEEVERLWREREELLRKSRTFEHAFQTLRRVTGEAVRAIDFGAGSAQLG